MKKYNITIVDIETKQIFEAKEIEMCMIHVANKREDGLYETHSFLGTEDEQEAFRMMLSLSRAIQDREFGHISPQIGQIVDETDLIKEKE